MFWQGRGITYLSKRDSNGIIGPRIAICQDALSVSLATDTFEHINKCGPVDVPDYTGDKGASGEVKLSYADQDDLRFALGVLGVVNAGGSGSVSGEIGPPDLVAGDTYGIGGTARHRAITSLVVTDSATSPGTAVLNTDYTLDAVNGILTIVDPSGFTQPFVLSYSYTDAASVAILAAGQPSYFLEFENINKANANDPGVFELYDVKFSPAQLVDLLSDELSILELTGKVQADPTKLVTDTLFGRFGRRIL